MRDEVRIQTLAYETGELRAGSILSPLGAIARIDRKAVTLEGAFELSIGGVHLLAPEASYGAKVEFAWMDAIAVITALHELRSAQWSITDLGVVAIEIIPGTRRAKVRFGKLEAEARIRTIAEAMLTEAERFFAWTARAGWKRRPESLDAIAALRMKRVPWRD